MDASRFDAWTRRRLGLVVGGGIASLAGLSLLEDAEAKKKKKKRCRKSLQPCGGKKKCCKELTCDDTLGTEGNVCCKPLQGTCADQSECCGETICDDVQGLSGLRCCVVVGEPCTATQDCCGNNACSGGECVP